MTENLNRRKVYQRKVYSLSFKHFLEPTVTVFWWMSPSLCSPKLLEMKAICCLFICINLWSGCQSNVTQAFVHRSIICLMNAINHSLSLGHYCKQSQFGSASASASVWLKVRGTSVFKPSITKKLVAKNHIPLIYDGRKTAPDGDHDLVLHEEQTHNTIA